MSVLLLADAKNFLRITGDSNDVELQATIDSAESTIADLVGPLVADEVTERVETDGETLALQWPVVTITSVEGVLPVETIDPDDLRLEDGILSYADGIQCFVSRFYDVTYTAGYDELPPEIVSGIKQLVKTLWRDQRGGVNMPGTASDEELDEAMRWRRTIDRYVVDEMGFA